MNHLNEGTILSLRDGEWVPEEASVHVEACAVCGAALLEARARSADIGRALDALDAPAIGDLEAARAHLRARVDARDERKPRIGSGRWTGHLGRAAAIVLVAAGAVSALPGSPIRSWLTGPEADVHTVRDASPAAAQEAATAGVAFTVPAGGIRVTILSLGTLDRLEVVWIEEGTARVDAPPGSRFTYGGGRVEAMVAGGPVRVELPRSGEPVSLDVDGRPYLSRLGNELEVTGPVGTRSEASILFTAP